MKSKIKSAIENINWTEENTQTHGTIVDEIRKYFNENNIEYGSFSYDDIKEFEDLILQQ